MVSGSVARRYAKALLSVGEEDGRWDSYAEELERVQAAFDASEDLRDLWLNPAHPRSARLASVDPVSKVLSLSPAVTNVVRLALERNRAADLEGIARAYRALADEKAGRVRAVVTSAAQLPPDVAEQVGAKLASLTGRRIVLETRVDPSLIGGLVAQVGSTLYDGSLRTQLERMRNHLREGRSQGL